MLSADLTAELLTDLALDTGNAAVDAVIETLTLLYRGEILELLDQRDKELLTWQSENVLSDEKLELLSEIAINVDATLSGLTVRK